MYYVGEVPWARGLGEPALVAGIMAYHLHGGDLYLGTARVGSPNHAYQPDAN